MTVVLSAKSTDVRALGGSYLYRESEEEVKWLRV